MSQGKEERMEPTMVEDKTKAQIVSLEIFTEYISAACRFPRFNSPHEGYAVILEELEELKAEVFKHHSKRDKRDMRAEAIQVGAMAMRFVIDLCMERVNLAGPPPGPPDPPRPKNHFPRG